MVSGMWAFAAAGALILTASGSNAAFAQKSGGILKVGQFDSPAGMSILEESLRWSRLFGQLSGRNKLKAWSRLLISPFPEIKIIPCCCGVL